MEATRCSPPGCRTATWLGMSRVVHTQRHATFSSDTRCVRHGAPQTESDWDAGKWPALSWMDLCQAEQVAASLLGLDSKAWGRTRRIATDAEVNTQNPAGRTRPQHSSTSVVPSDASTTVRVPADEAATRGRHHTNARGVTDASPSKARASPPSPATTVVRSSAIYAPSARCVGRM